MTTRPYQGYPYSNPFVQDVPTVDGATASRWNNLPRRPILPPRDTRRRPNEAQTDKKEPDPVIYIDVPDRGCSDVAGPASDGPEPVNYGRPNDGLGPSGKKEPDPMIFIDVPDRGDSDVAGPAPADPEPEYVQYYARPNDGLGPSGKKEPDPMIFIDVPDRGDSDVAGPAPADPEPEYVQETIFYDQFEDRRIDRHKSTDSGSPGTRPRRPAPPAPRPTPPSSLDLHGSGSSGYASSSPSLPSSREPYNDDRFHPTPVSPYPEPPPAYSEIDTPHTPPSQTPQLQTPPDEPPRTIVITHGPETSDEQPPIGLASADRKVVYCHHCGNRVHTLVIWQSGPFTHVIAFLLFFFMLPLIVLVYCTNCCKYKNHYCPNCNKKIGHEVPALCISMTLNESNE